VASRKLAQELAQFEALVQVFKYAHSASAVVVTVTDVAYFLLRFIDQVIMCLSYASDVYRMKK